MKALERILNLLLVSSILFFGCKDDSEDLVQPLPEQDFATLQNYMLANDLDLPNILDGWITGAPAADDVNSFISSNYIMDIRSAGDFAAGHIEGAAHSALGTIVSDAASSAGKPIIVVCYTGQSAAHAVVALRLSGYSNAKVLKFGMSGWHSGLDSWSSNTGDIAIGNPAWTNTPTIASPDFTGPDFNAVATDGAGILAERVAVMTSGGFKGINSTDVLANPSGYMINNYWDQVDVDHYGCINGALRVKPLSLAGIEYTNLDPSETIVTYCWTGQTSSMITAYLTVLGYDAKSLKFGVNGMIYSDLESHKFTTPSVDLPVVTE